jgi:hypothetical protein
LPNFMTFSWYLKKSKKEFSLFFEFCCHDVTKDCWILGTIGHVTHGKSTVVKAISGVHVLLHAHTLTLTPRTHSHSFIYLILVVRVSDGAFQKRTRKKSHHQTRICKC